MVKTEIERYELRLYDDGSILVMSPNDLLPVEYENVIEGAAWLISDVVKLVEGVKGES